MTSSEDDRPPPVPRWKRIVGRIPVGRAWATRLSPLIFAVIAVGVVLTGTVVWLAVSGAPEPSGVVVALHAPIQPPAASSFLSTKPVVLAAAPDAALIEQTPDLAGPLPIVAPDGKASWLSYGRPFDKGDSRHRIAFVLNNLGTSGTDTDAAIRSMPGDFTLSFMPYRKGIIDWIAMARAAGHEVLLDLPMEPTDLQHNDPGPNALRTALDPKTNIERLRWMMSQATGYVGFTAFMGSRFETDRSDIGPVLDEMHRRGLLFVDNRASQQSVAPNVAGEIGLPFAAASVIISDDLPRVVIDRRLQDLEDIALQGGVALGIGESAPAIRDALTAWEQTLSSRGFVLAPVSAMVSIATAPKKPEAAETKATPSTAPAGQATPKKE